MKTLLHWFWPSVAELEDSTEERQFLVRCLGVSLVLHLITAWFSVGYHFADEQFQILEFISYKLGVAPAANLATEFREQMRPWMQPAIYWSIVQVLKKIGIENPFHWAFAFRVFTGLLGWLGLWTLALASRSWFPDLRARRFVMAAMTWMWFLPALHIRPSSESMGASAFLLGFGWACLKLRKRGEGWAWALAGALFGLSFEARFQMGLMILGFYAWLLVFGRGELGSRKELVKAIGFCTLGLGTVIGLGRIADFWGYGVWVFTPYNYFSYNLIRGEISQYGNAPWWDVFRMSFTESWPFLGLGVAICSIVAWIRHPKHPLTWSQVPFFLAHEWIGHKELRFFFPIAAAAPLLVTLCFYSGRTSQWIRIPESLWKWLRWPWDFLLLNNGVALLVLAMLPVSRTILFYEGIYQRIPSGPEKTEFFYYPRDPFHILGNPIYFYPSQHLDSKEVRSFQDLAGSIPGRTKTFWLAYLGFEVPAEVRQLLPLCRKEYQSLPGISKKVNFGNWLERANAWSLYKCDPNEST